MTRRATRLVLVAALCAAPACDGDRAKSERVVDRAYDAYEAVARAIQDSPDCGAGIARAQRLVEERRGDLAAAFELQRNEAWMRSARPVLEERRERFDAIATALEAAFGRCSGTPGLDRVGQALDRPAGEPP